MKLLTFIPVIILNCLLAAGCVPGNYIQSDIKINTREKITVKLEINERKDMALRGVILILPGGGGEINGTNYVVRESTRFVERGYAAAIMDVPSDMWTMPVEFRWSHEHQEDIGKVTAYLKKRYPQKPLFMIGFSNGNFSSMYFLASRAETDIAGVICMAAPWQAMYSLCFTRAFYLPVLIVHHEGDMCDWCHFSGAQMCYEQMEVKGRKNLLSVRYGTLTSRYGTECGPYHYHAFEGLETKVTNAVIDWMDGRSIPSVIK